MNNFVSNILVLSDEFYNDYPSKDFPEILWKRNRPYNCIVFNIDNKYICLPYRTNIHHKNAYLFSKSVRSSIKNSGIDYSKMIIITDEHYLGKQGIIDDDEYKETYNNLEEIVNGAYDYLTKYIEYVTNSKNKIGKNKFNRNYGKSTLPYFHKELGLQY